MPKVPGFWMSLDNTENSKQFFQAPKNDTNSFIIGRLPGADGIYVKDEWINQGVVGSRISRTHCVVTSQNGVFIVNNKSDSGTWVEKHGNPGHYSKLEKDQDTVLMQHDVLYLIDPQVSGYCPAQCVLQCDYDMNSDVKPSRRVLMNSDVKRMELRNSKFRF